MAPMLENTGAGAVKFTKDELPQFNKELDAIQIKGERLPAPVLQFSNVEAPGEEITGRKTYKVYKTI
jgi:hypothetical protein